MIKETHVVECFCDVCGKSHDLCPRCAKSIARGIEEMKRRKFIFGDYEL